MKKYIIKYLIFIIGLYFLAAGIVLILRSSLGTTPISSVNYVLSLNTPITLGTWTFLINMLLIIGQFWFIRDRMTRRDTMEILLQIPFSLLFGVFIDFNMVLTEALHPAHYAAAIMMLFAGCLIQFVGVVLEIKPRMVMMSAEGFVNYASRRYNKDFGKIKDKGRLRHHARNPGHGRLDSLLATYRRSPRGNGHRRLLHGLHRQLS